MTTTLRAARAYRWNRLPLRFEQLESRDCPSMTVFGADQGGGPLVVAYDTQASLTTPIKQFYAYDASFRGGVRVALADISGDNVPDIITAAGPGGGPHVKVFDGVTNKVIRSFFAFDPSFTGGVYVAGGDVDDDGFGDIVVAAGAGGGPHVQVFSGATGKVIRSFFAYGASFSGGVRVGAGDVNNDGYADIITGAGPGGGPHVRVFDGKTGNGTSGFFAYPASFAGGVNVAAGDLDGDGQAEIITGPGLGGGPLARVWSGANAQKIREFNAFAPGQVGLPVSDPNTLWTSGLVVGVADVPGGGALDIATGPGAGRATVIRIFSSQDQAQMNETSLFAPAFMGGTSVGGISKPVFNGTSLQANFSANAVNEGSIGSVSFTNPSGGSGGYIYSFDLDNNGAFEITNSATSSATVLANLLNDGPGSRTLRGRIQDSTGAFTDYTTLVTINNVAPTVQLSGPFAGVAGSALNFAAAVTDPSPVDTTAGFTYSWTFGDGGTSTQKSPAYTYAKAGTYAVSLTVADKDNGTRTSTFNITISAVGAPPQGTFTGGTANEGNNTDVVFSNATGGTGKYTYSFDFDNNGTFEVSDSTVGLVSVPAQYFPDGPGSRVVRGRIKDSAGLFTDYTTTINIMNVPPTVQLGGPYSAAPNSSVAFAAGASDPSPIDGAAGFTYTWDFGDGAKVSGKSASVSHVYNTAGKYALSLSVTDKDGGVTIKSTNVTVGVSTSQSVAIGLDQATKGNWQGVHGNSGHLIIGGPTSLPNYAQVVPSGQSSFIWSKTTTEQRALDNLSGGRIAACWYAGSSFSINLSLTDGASHGLALYFLDWDNSGRNQQIEILDAQSGAMLTSQPVSNFNNGVYALFNVTGNVKIQISSIGNTSPVVSGLFLDASPFAVNQIVTPNDRIPNFGLNPTIAAVNSGSWSEVTTWSLGRLPVVGDVVTIGPNRIVTYDVSNQSPIRTVAIEAGGSLRFRTDINTRLTVNNLFVREGGELQIGTQANPVAANVKAEVIFADAPLDLANDPDQYGNGLIAMGKVTMHGAAMSDTFVRLAVEPIAGATVLTLASPVTGWKVGDRLVLPDSRHLIEGEFWGNYQAKWETVTIAQISPDGLTISLSQPVQFDHEGARNPDGVLEFLPHVGNLSRNISLRSQNNFGTRGHTYFTHRAEVDIRYAAFQGLGRTTNVADDNTTRDASGQVNHVGTNQGDRFPVNFEHLLGPIGGTANGSQYIFLGNAVSCMMNPQPYRWGIAINDSHYGLIQDNVVYNWAGAGIAIVTPSTSYNHIVNNFVVATRGDDNPRNNTGRDGSAFWTRGFNNYFLDNIAASAVGSNQGIVAGSGFNLGIWAAPNANTRIPLFPGADLTVAGQYQLTDAQLQPILQFQGNQTYGATATGMTLWHLGTDGYSVRPANQTIIKDFVAWHVWEEGFYGYPIQNVLFDGFTVRGHSRARTYWGGGGWTSGDYWAGDVTIRNADIQGMNWGIGNSSNTPGAFRIEDSYLRNYNRNVIVNTLATPGARANKLPRTTYVDNVRFATYPGAPGFETITMAYSDSNASSNFIQRDDVLVHDYDGIAGVNFQVYYYQQSPAFIVPQTTYYGPDNNNDGIPDAIDSLGSPSAGMTNAQNWATYGIAIAGGICPTTNTVSGISGYVRVM